MIHHQEEKWQAVLDRIKKRGRTRQWIKKTCAVLLSAVILGLAWKLWISPAPENAPSLAWQETETAVLISMDIFYDEDLGFID